MLRFSGLLSAVTLALLTLSETTAGLSTANATECKSVRGHLEETLLPPSDCTSPVGPAPSGGCGHLKGEARFTASAIIDSADTPATGVVFVTGDSIVANA